MEEIPCRLRAFGSALLVLSLLISGPKSFAWQVPSAPESPVPVRPASGKIGRFLPRERVYVPPAPRKKPSLTPGQRFFCLGGNAGLVTPQGNAVVDVEVELQVLVLRRVSPTRLTFVNEDGSRVFLLPLTAPTHDEEKLPGGLVPVVEDAEVEAMRKKYEGKFVVAYPTFYLQGRMHYPTAELPFRFSGAKLLRLLRLRWSSPYPLTTGWYDFSTYDPLIALFDTSLGMRYAGNGDDLWTMDEFERDAVFKETGSSGSLHCFAYFAGAWDMERSINLTGGGELAAHWPATYRTAFWEAKTDAWAFKHLKKGMTTDMIAWIMGWPPQYGTRDELRRQSRWTYKDATRGDVSIFFEHGRVTRWSGNERYEPSSIP